VEDSPIVVIRARVPLKRSRELQTIDEDPVTFFENGQNTVLLVTSTAVGK
jgi:nucleosome binding factor SPN SPT16 subunit